MKLTKKIFLQFSVVTLTGLSAGFFYGWQISVIPGTKLVNAITYLETMQSINREILNTSFFTIFFGTLIGLSIATIYSLKTSKIIFRLFLFASLTYILGTFGVTAMGNVPLNKELELINISKLSIQKASEFRKYYEYRWNQMHLIRTVFAILSFLLTTLTMFIQSNKS